MSRSVVPTWGVVFVAGVGLLVSLGVGFQTGVAYAHREAAEDLGDMVNVVVATEAIPAGAPISTRGVVVRAFPSGTVPPDPLVFHHVGDVAGRIALVSLLPNEVVRAERVGPPTR